MRKGDKLRVAQFFKLHKELRNRSIYFDVLQYDHISKNYETWLEEYDDINKRYMKHNEVMKEFKRQRVESYTIENIENSVLSYKLCKIILVDWETYRGKSNNFRHYGETVMQYDKHKKKKYMDKIRKENRKYGY